MNSRITHSLQRQEIQFSNMERNFLFGKRSHQFMKINRKKYEEVSSYVILTFTVNKMGSH